MLKKIISVILMLCVIFTGTMPLVNQSYALTTYKEVTKYHLDLGVIHIWGNGSDKYNAVYQDGLTYNTSKPFTASISFPEEIKRVDKAYVLDSSTFQWNNSPTYTFNETVYLTDGSSFDANYLDFVSNNISNIKPTLSGTHTVNLSYTALLKSKADYDLSTTLNMGGYDEIIKLLGGEESVKPDLKEKLEEGRDKGIAPGVFGYMFFVSIVIQYTAVEEVTLNLGEFTADLDVPASAKPGDSFNVADKSAFYDTSEFACTQLSYSVDSGSSKPVAGWKGTALGESISQSFADECSVTYTIETWNTYGDSKTASKTINISNDHDIEINPDLVLPEYTYEGHKEIAKDESTFVVDGIDYSASRIYAEGLARNTFKANSGTISIQNINSTKSECTFSQKGTYNVTLDIRADGGTRASDTESVEVRKTPYIIDNLSGFQKQNRKQILNITVATYPGKPLTDYTITLKDKKTGETVTLTPTTPQANTTTIKTRAVTMTQDTENGFAYITVEFLTKTPSFASTGTSPQEFYYDIHVEDSKGDTDTASKIFSVNPDLPPTAAISIDTAFLRNEGTNIASIKTEDITVATDGDEVERTWYFGHGVLPLTFTDVSAMPGYQKLSFGTDKIVGFDKPGVGKFTVKLYVKEKWTEPTLEEYVTDADHLTGYTMTGSDVLNVAPVVSLELSEAIQKDVLLLANNPAEYTSLLNIKIPLKQALLGDKIDADIVIKKLLGSTPPQVTGTTKMYDLYFPAPVFESGGPDEVGYYQMINDSERAYIETWTWVGNSPAVPATVRAYDPYAGQVWSYTTMNSNRFSFAQDDQGKYLYLIYANETILLDKRTGAVAGTIPKAMPSNIWLTDDSFYSIESETLYRTDQNTLAKTALDTNVSSLFRVGKVFKYITKTENSIVVNTYNPGTGSIAKQLLVDTTNGVSSLTDYMPVGIGTDDRIILFKSKGYGTDTFNGFRVYSTAGTLIKEIPVELISGLKGVYAPQDADGTIPNAVIHYNPKSYDNSFIGVNLITGVASPAFYKKTSTSARPIINTAYTSQGITYLYEHGWYLYGGAYYCGVGMAVEYNGSSVYNSGNGRINAYDENNAVSDRIFTSLFGSNVGGGGNYTQIRVSALLKTAEQEIAEILSKYSNPDTYIGGIGTTAEQIKAAALDQPEKFVKASAINDGFLTLNSQKLRPGKKYYYEYDIKPLTEGIKDKLTGISASTGTVTSNQTFINDTLYVTDSYEEDFNSGKINSFFTVNDAGKFYNGKYGAYRDDYPDSYMKLSFVVPSGKQAAVSLDYSLKFDNRTPSNYYAGTHVFIDGMKVKEDIVYGNNNGSYSFIEDKSMLFYKLLNAGTHTIECKVSADSGSWEHVLIDNLRVDLLSAAPKTIDPILNIQSGDSEGWLTLNGSFDVPNKVISYGAQVSSTYWGGIPSEVTATYFYKKKGTYHDRSMNYYQTVPAGYIQKGRVHLGSGRFLSNGYTEFNIVGTPEFRIDYKDCSYIDTWITLQPKTAGTYIHSLYNGHPEDTQSWMDVFDLVTYPDNEVTRTGDMAFNSTNTKYFFPKVVSTQSTDLNMFIPEGEYVIKNLRLYYMENGQRVYMQNKCLNETAQLAPWGLSPGLTAAAVSLQEEESDDEYIKIYKKGEKVLYNIFYDDYEKDPSKAGYWQYSHVNWPPDGIHPDAGKILNKPIDRFYLSGKYTVTHWQKDNTQRSGTVGDADPYNKESNAVDLTFYVDGGGSAPWITYIKTNPLAVKENNSYTLSIGVDDSEKDVLMLETEIYHNGKNIFTHREENLQANPGGDYPETLISGLPQSQTGVYQVICIVRDYGGAGIESYKFIVVSEGKITGGVYHTEQWDVNRKKYNLKRFSEEVNHMFQFNDYMAMTAPRKRGTNVFWSGEKFMLRAETEGKPSGVTVKINELDSAGNLSTAGYYADLQNTGRKTASGAELWDGSLWESSMINKWGRKAPEILVFNFTAYYPEGTVKEHTAAIIVDSEHDYWQLHRLW